MSNTEHDFRSSMYIESVAILFFLASFICSSIIYSKMCNNRFKGGQLDVYRGKTELQIKKTFTGDNITNVDSTVVYKK